MCAVLKADAYHLGAEEVGAYLNTGADFFAVATAEEALKLAGRVTKPVLVLSFPEEDLAELAARNIRVTVHEARQREILARIPGAVAHVKFDSGMNRLGFRSLGEALGCLDAGFRVEGVFTHLFSEEPILRRYQLDRFSEVAEAFRRRQPDILAHVGGSGISGCAHGFDMTRTGIDLYRGAAVLKARIIGIKEVGPDDYLSYGETLSGIARRVAAVSCGYADGVPRALAGRYCVRVRGRRCPVVGAVCMDMLLADVSGSGAEIGDEVVVVGDFGEAAAAAGTIDYEIMTGVSERVKRVYIS